MIKQAKLASHERLPELAMPADTPTRFDSAMPTLKNRCGNFLAKKSVRVELCTSPSRTTMSGYCSPSLANARPNASRVDLPIFIWRHPRLRFKGRIDSPPLFYSRNGATPTRSVSEGRANPSLTLRVGEYRHPRLTRARPLSMVPPRLRALRS